MIFRVGTSVIDCDRREVWRNGVDCHVPRKTFDLLKVLLDERPKVVPKDDLISRVWPDTFVADANLAVLIGDLRAALGDSAKKPTIIKTHHGVGYSFSADVIEVNMPSMALPIAILVLGSRKIALSPGSITVGRDERCDVVLAHPSVSKMHARVTVADDSVVVEDTDSKNGTFVDDQRLSKATPVKHGQRITFGSIQASMLIETPSKSTTMTISGLK